MLKGRQELELELGLGLGLGLGLELELELVGQWTCRWAALQAATWEEGKITLECHGSLYLRQSGLLLFIHN